MASAFVENYLPAPAASYNLRNTELSQPRSPARDVASAQWGKTAHRRRMRESSHQDRFETSHALDLSAPRARPRSTTRPAPRAGSVQPVPHRDRRSPDFPASALLRSAVSAQSDR